MLTNYTKSHKKDESIGFKALLSSIATKTNSQPRQYGSGYIVRCPAHNDKRPSLSMSERDNGKILLHCFVGCPVYDVCAALGLNVSDLFAKQDRGHHGK